MLIPAFFKLVDLLYDIIPRKLLKKIIDILVSLKLVAIWHYLLIGAAILVELVLEGTEGALSTVVTNLAYPLGDVLLLSTVVGVFSLTGWRPGRRWPICCAGQAGRSRPWPGRRL